MTNRHDARQAAAELDIADLHASLTEPVSESMNFLNEVAQRYPDAISLAAGRPHEEFFDLDDIHRHLATYRRYLHSRLNGDEVLVRRAVMQYGRTKGIIHDLIARHLSVDESITVEPDSIVVTVGCQEALYLTLRALRRDRRDVLLAVSPSYVGVHGAAQLADMSLLPVREGPEGIDLDDLVAVAARAKTSGLRPRACYVVPDFANPSGVRLREETRRHMLAIAAEQDFLVLEDNPYGLFADPPGPPTMKALDGSGRRVVYLGTFSKTGIPGARVGYVVADQRVSGAHGGTEMLADQLAKLKSMLTVNTSPITQAVIGGKLLENDFSLRAANRREAGTYRRNLRQVLDGLERRFASGMSGSGVSCVTWNVPAGGFFLLLTVPFTADDRLLEFSAREYRVLWTPLHHFFIDATPRNVIRLSFSHLWPQEIEDGLDRLAGFVRAQSGS